MRPRIAAALLGTLVAAPAAAEPAFVDVTERLGPQDPRRFTMDVATGDVDGDGDADLVLALEFVPNVLLLNDGRGRFAPAPLPSAPHDSEDAALGDTDGDGDLDLVVVTEDDRTDEYLLNDGTGRFTPARALWPAHGITNGLALADLDGDGDLDAALGNNGPNALLLNDGAGRFEIAGPGLFPRGRDVTQDIAVGDLDGDGAPDLVVANEGPDRILMARAGRFVDETEARLPGQGQGGESRDAALADLDGDGDLDLLFANVRLFTDLAPQNRLWINDGAGRFADETAARLPPDAGSSMDAAFVDLDGDGDPDLVTAEFGDITGRSFTTPFQAYRNDGGRFAEATAAFLPESARGNGMHVEVADLDGDGRPELILASRGGPDRLLTRRPPP